MTSLSLEVKYVILSIVYSVHVLVVCYLGDDTPCCSYIMYNVSCQE